MLLFIFYLINEITEKVFDTTPSTTVYLNHFYIKFVLCSVDLNKTTTGHKFNVHYII